MAIGSSGHVKDRIGRFRRQFAVRDPIGDFGDPTAVVHD
jgi:hypothetical protein